jgi:acyl-CoA reductase-like NAD-dependent aldehyde dehydrogenase
MSATELFLGGRWVAGGTTEILEQKYTGDTLAEVGCATTEQVDEALSGLAAAAEEVLHPFERYEILLKTSQLIEAHRERLITTIVDESGFTRRDAATEVDRGVQTMRLSAEEATRLAGEMVPLEGFPGVQNRVGYTIRVPVGVVCAITPFNSPLNTVCHKLGPALAAGNVVALKPAIATPLTSQLLVDLLLEAGLPETHVALLQGPGSTVGAQLLEDERISFYTFTGSTEVGKLIQRTVGLRRTQLELGSLSSTLVCHDADLEHAASRCAGASFRKAGQVCTSVQRIQVDARVADEFADALVEATKTLPAGDPHDPDTVVGPLISEPEVTRVHDWITTAVDGGGRLLHGGQRDNRVIQPTILAGVAQDADVVCREVFGPVVSLATFDDLDAAMDQVNATPYGLAAGIFTKDLDTAYRASRRLHVGTVHINETSSSRIDLMPYGGVKDSGFGHEGPKYAAREMTEERLITITHGR